MNDIKTHRIKKIKQELKTIFPDFALENEPKITLEATGIFGKTFKPHLLWSSRYVRK